MTQLSQKIIKCLKCKTENRIIYYASINTILDIDGTLVEKLLKGTLNTSKCRNCGVNIRLSSDVLINCPKGMFYLNPTDDLEYKKQQLKHYEILSEEGTIKSGLESFFYESKKKLDETKDNHIKISTIPPAPKVTSYTKIYNEMHEEIAKILGETKGKNKVKNSKKTDSPPPPPPPPPSEE